MRRLQCGLPVSLLVPRTLRQPLGDAVFNTQWLTVLLLALLLLLLLLLLLQLWCGTTAFAGHGSHCAAWLLALRAAARC